MPTSSAARTEGSRMYDELLAVHTIMSRGVGLVAGSFDRLAQGQRVDRGTLTATGRWLVGFVRHHHHSEDDLFWPVLRGLFPRAVADLDALTAEHEALDTELDGLGAALDMMARGTADRAMAEAVARGRTYAASVDAVLAAHLDAEEPVLRELFQQVPDADIVRLRKAIVASAPRTGPHLVLGLLEDPEPVPGHEEMRADLPAVLGLLRPLLLRRYRTVRRALAVPAR
jgi:hemerythrin-like domain-containing protein